MRKTVLTALAAASMSLSGCHATHPAATHSTPAATSELAAVKADTRYCIGAASRSAAPSRIPGTVTGPPTSLAYLARHPSTGPLRWVACVAAPASRAAVMECFRPALAANGTSRPALNADERALAECVLKSVLKDVG